MLFKTEPSLKNQIISIKPIFLLLSHHREITMNKKLQYKRPFKGQIESRTNVFTCQNKKPCNSYTFYIYVA